MLRLRVVCSQGKQHLQLNGKAVIGEGLSNCFTQRRSTGASLQRPKKSKA